MFSWLGYRYLRRTLFSLIFGSLLILIGCAIVSNNLLWIKYRLTDNFFIDHISQIAAKLDHTETKTRATLVPLLQIPGIHLALKHQRETAKPLPKINRYDIAEWVKHPLRHHHALRIPLKDHQFLVVHIKRQPFWLSSYLLIDLGALVLMIILQILLCIWAVHRLTNPMISLNEQIQHIKSEDDITLINQQHNDLMNGFVESFNHVQSHTRQMMRDRTQMLAAISHDLRTYITRLKLRLEQLTDTPQYPKLKQDIEAMEAMTKDVLTYAHLNDHNEHRQTFDLNALLDSLCSDLQDTGFDVTYHNQDHKLTYHGSLQALQRAFMNLISNAAHYGKAATVQLAQKNNHLHITIDDQGEGIPKNDLDKVFQPFYRCEPSRSRKTGGSGLGLTIANSIIKNHGGDIKFKYLAAGFRSTVILPK